MPISSPSYVTVTGKTGAGQAVTALGINNVKRFNLDCKNFTVEIESPDLPDGSLEVDISEATSVTVDFFVNLDGTRNFNIEIS